LKGSFGSPFFALSRGAGGGKTEHLARAGRELEAPGQRLGVLVDEEVDRPDVARGRHCRVLGAMGHQQVEHRPVVNDRAGLETMRFELTRPGVRHRPLRAGCLRRQQQPGHSEVAPRPARMLDLPRLPRPAWQSAGRDTARAAHCGRTGGGR
jgi:hypothetical protein